MSILLSVILVLAEAVLILSAIAGWSKYQWAYEGWQRAGRAHDEQKRMTHSYREMWGEKIELLSLRTSEKTDLILENLRLQGEVEKLQKKNRRARFALLKP